MVVDTSGRCTSIEEILWCAVFDVGTMDRRKENRFDDFLRPAQDDSLLCWINLGCSLVAAMKRGRLLVSWVSDAVFIAIVVFLVDNDEDESGGK
jgi:hypothetical protein